MARERTRRSLFYLAGYLLFGGLGFLTIPRLMLAMFLSDGSYDDVMVRFVGLLLLSLGILIIQMIRHRVEALYPATLFVRSIILVALVWFYFRTKDPLMVVLLGIVGLGFVFTLTSYWLDRGK